MLTNTSSRITTFLTLMLLCDNIRCTSEFVQTIYRRLEGGGVYASSSRETRKAQSLAECAVQCRGLVGCSAVEFEAPGRTCSLFTWPMISVPARDGSSEVWVSSAAGLIMVARQNDAEMTYSEAKELCSSLGGSLPSPQEMYDALDAGLNLCRCGWTHGEIIRLVLTESDPDCANINGETGVISCKWLTSTADTFCKLN